MTIQITSAIALDDDEVQFSFIRASGPGGQNVNKTATAVQLRFDAARSPALPEEVRKRLMRLAGKRMTTEGVLLIEARRFRTQAQNRQEALDHLAMLVRQAARKPKIRRKTRPTLAGQQKRLESKRRRSAAKRLRQSALRDE